eukprot:GHVU01096226.1.p1 GENE.GHVU01096226.1~~GHVU01096226.1.p1  ORF type:complete len:130 (+),score=10.50 GHVU01096226.1:885-1274(+)
MTVIQPFQAMTPSSRNRTLPVGRFYDLAFLREVKENDEIFIIERKPVILSILFMMRFTDAQTELGIVSTATDDDSLAKRFIKGLNRHTTDGKLHVSIPALVPPLRIRITALYDFFRLLSSATAADIRTS